MKNDIVILTTSTFSRAALIKTMLEDENIACFLSNVNLVQPSVSFGVKIRVFERDLTRSLKIVREIEKRHGKDLISGKKKPMRIRRILVPVDFSSYSLNAARLALLLAGRLGADVRFFHAFYNPVLDSMSFPDAFTYQANMAEIYKEMKVRAKREMKKFVVRLLEESRPGHQEIKISKKLIAGTPGEEILSEAEIFKPEVILIGTRGSGENPNEPIGNVTSSILDKTKIPVLVIPENCRFDHTLEKINVLYTTDFDETDSDAIKKLMAVIAPFEFNITCIHVSRNIRDQVIVSKMKDLKAELLEIYHDLRLECELIRDNDKVEGIRKAILKKSIDLVTLTHHKRSILYRILEPSLASKMIFQTEKPVLIFHG